MAPPNFTDDDRFDGLYMNVANTAKGIEPLLDTVFSFLRRKTDFFTGPPGNSGSEGGGSQKAIEKVMEILQKHADLHQLQQQKKDKPKKAVPKKEAKPKKVQPPKKDPDVIELGEDGFDISEAADINTAEKNDSSNSSSSSSPAVAASPSASSETPAPPAPPSSDDDNTDADDKSPPPVGNGGIVPDRYTWTQTLAEVNLTTPLPPNTRAKHLKVNITKTRLTIQLLTTTPPTTIVNSSKLTKSVIVDDTFWTIEDGDKLCITLQKSNQMEWWDSVCQDDANKINVQKVEPENSSLGDLDGDTRQTVEKMMFDQRQKALGLPNSEEQKKQDMLDKFMKQHPEMDFSKAKIT